jgi:hypothetical protein
MNFNAEVLQFRKLKTNANKSNIDHHTAVAGHNSDATTIHITIRRAGISMFKK